MDSVRIGVIGAGGGMAGNHLRDIAEMDGVPLAAVSDISQDALDRLKEKYPDARSYTDASAMIAAASDGGGIDAVLIACPHYDHPRYCREAFDAGVHVLCEKPIAVTAKAAQEVNEAYAAAVTKNPGLIFAGMFNQRTNPEWKEVHRLCTDGSLGQLMRVSWTITSWFRTQTYYDSGGWRATWSGEGGGVLINQCPHNLDLLQWFVGLPKKVTANVSLGKYHHIEVEDDVTALLEFDNGATGTFVTTTGQSPGINRLEIVGDRGTIIYDGKAADPLVFLRTDGSVKEFTAESEERFGDIPATRLAITAPPAKGSEHSRVIQNFVQTVARGGTQDDLIAPGTEMIHGLELGNAMLMSGLKQQPVPLPTDREAFDQMLDELKNNSTFKKNETKSGSKDLSGSF